MGEAGYNARGGSNPSSSALAAGRLGAFRGDRTGGADNKQALRGGCQLGGPQSRDWSPLVEGPRPQQLDTPIGPVISQRPKPPIRDPGPPPIPRGNAYGLQRPNQHRLALG